MLSRGDYLEGLVFFLPTLGACVGAGVLATTRRFRGLDPSVGVTAGGLLATGALAAAHLIPLALGVMTRATVVAAALALLGAAFALTRRTTQAGPPPELPPASPASSWVMAAAACAFVGVAAIAYLVQRSHLPVTGLDAMNSHLPQSARWIQSGSAWQLDQFNVNFAGSTYPDNGNLMQLALILPWRSLYAVRCMGVPFMALTAVGVYATALELRAPRAPALLAAAAVVALPAVALPALDLAQVDTPMYAWLAAGLLFLLRWSRHRRDSELVLAGIGLGLAFGTKWYAVGDVPVIVAVWAAALLVARTPWRVVLRAGALVAGLVLATGGFWLLRNWVEAGDPFHPVVVRLFGVTIWDSPPDPFREQAGFSIAHYATDSGVWRHYLVPAFKQQLGGAGLVLGVAALVALVVAVVRLRRTRDAGDLRVAALGVAAIGMAVVYVMLPFTAFGLEGRPILASANVRYVVPALLAAAPLAAWLCGRAGRLRFAAELLLLAGTLDSARRAFPGVGFGDVARGVVVIAALAAAAALLVLAARRRRGAVVAFAAVACVVLLVAGEGLRRRASDFDYGKYDTALGWVLSREPPGARVGLAGAWSVGGLPPVAPAFGPRLRNEVVTVARLHDGSMTAYDNRADFARALRAGNYDALLVGTGSVPQPPSRVRELAWARAEGFVPAAGSQRLIALARSR
jgi:Dolichyl-phosphate-mannose-protein mannosyltransferase